VSKFFELQAAYKASSNTVEIQQMAIKVTFFHLQILAAPLGLEPAKQ